MQNEFSDLKTSKLFVLAITLIFCFYAMISSINAQNTRRNNSVRPAATPTPNQTVPVIISRAEDIPSENQVVLTPVQPSATDSLEEKIDKFNEQMAEINSRLKTLESSQKNEYDEKQKRLLLNLDILTKAEQRAESLRKQLYDLVEKENSLQTRLEQININLQPSMIESSAALAGSLRPEEIREQRQKALEAEKSNVETLLSQMRANRLILEENVNKADLLVEKVRSKTEKEIDDALIDDKENPQ